MLKKQTSKLKGMSKSVFLEENNKSSQGSLTQTKQAIKDKPYPKERGRKKQR